MTPLVKAALVAAGYVGAVLFATAVVAVHVAATNGPDRQGASGMYGFGDSLFFLAAFGAAAVLPTGAGLFFLRPYPAFWRAFRGTALAIAATGVVALIDYLVAQSLDPKSAFYSWSALAVLRIIVAPLFALLFLLSGLFAPNRSLRVALLVATVVEAVVFGVPALMMLLRSRGR
jgi:hypothetical protein